MGFTHVTATFLGFIGNIMWELYRCNIDAFYLHKSECLALTVHISGAVCDVVD